MKKIIYACLFAIFALYWAPPSLQFNIVDAKEKMSMADPALTAHSMMVKTYLSGALNYLDGLDRQLKSKVPASDPVVKQHLDAYTAEITQTLANAKVHLGEYQSTLSRAPAAEKKASDVAKARGDLDDAIRMNDKMRQDVTNLKVTPDQVSMVRDQIQKVLKDSEALIPGSA